MSINKAPRPRARTHGLIVQELDDETLVYDQQRHRAHCLNITSSLVWKSCDGTRTVREIATHLSAEMNVLVSDEIVVVAVDKLASRHLMAEAERLTGRSGPTRREVLRRIGIGVAVAIPVITSIVSPHAAQAATCLPSGATCSTSAQCCSGVCNITTCA